MRLLPQDLGTKWHILTVRNRALGVASVWKKPEAPHLGTLGKRWIKDLPVSAEVAEATLPMTKPKTGNVAWGLGAGLGWIFPVLAVAFATGGGASPDLGGTLIAEAVTLGLGSAYLYGTFIGLPRMHLKKLHGAAITEDELTPFLTGNVPGLPQMFGEMAGKVLRFLNGRGVGMDENTPGNAVADDLERSFLLLVRDVVRSNNVPTEAQGELRDAVRSIGEALCRLPNIGEVGAMGGSLLAADQLAEARMLYARADRETDSVIAGSLRRQASALEAASRASENAVTVSRRVRVLRQELRAQIDVLRLTFPTWGRVQAATTTNVVAPTEQKLSAIAEAVQSVAREAASIADAQDELDGFLNNGTRTYQTDAAPDVQSLRAGR